MDKIVLKNMRFRSFSGVLPKEKEDGQDFVITLTLTLKDIPGCRTDKLSASVKMKVADDTWVAFFYDLYKNHDSVTFKQYSPLLHGYETRTVRLTGFKYKKVKHSEDLKAVTGVWEVSFNIEEF